MTVVFYISPNSNTYFYEHVLRCALARADCEVVSICDRRFFGERHIDSKMATATARRNWPNIWRKYMVENEWAKRHGNLEMNRSSFARWLTIASICDEIGDTPMVCPDWDVLITRPVQDAFGPVEQNDICWCANPILLSSDASLDIVDFWNARTAVDSLYPNDMTMFVDYRNTRKGMSQFMCVPESELYVDWNMHLHTDYFEPDPSVDPVSGLPAKRIVWDGNKPFFVRASDKHLYPAHIIHCWGTYKGLIAETAAKVLA